MAEMRGADTNFLFCQIYQHKAVNRHLSTCTVKRLIKVVGKSACSNRSEVSSHSIRVGAAQGRLCAGHDTAAIMRAGGWKSNQRTLRNRNQFTTKPIVEPVKTPTPSATKSASSRLRFTEGCMIAIASLLECALCAAGAHDGHQMKPFWGSKSTRQMPDNAPREPSPQQSQRTRDKVAKAVPAYSECPNILIAAQHEVFAPLKYTLLVCIDHVLRRGI